MEEWIKLFLESSNVILVDDHEFKDPYIFFRDSTCHGITSYELLIYFYHNIVEKIPICNPWKKNLEKLIFQEVLMDIYLVKALIKSYNPAMKYFHRTDGTILCTLDRASFIEAFGLGGVMSEPVDMVDL